VKNQSIDPTTVRIGDIVMANRTYNSKRIVWEPVAISGWYPDPNWPGKFRFTGKWLLDGKETSLIYAGFKPFDPKWVERKIESINKEVDILNEQKDNLKKILFGVVKS